MRGYSINVRIARKIVFVNGYINPSGSGSNLILMAGFPMHSGYSVFGICASDVSSLSGFCRINDSSHELKFNIPEAQHNYVFNFSYISD